MSKNLQVAARFVAVFLTVFIAQATLLHASTARELAAAAAAALPLALEKFTVSAHGGPGA